MGIDMKCFSINRAPRIMYAAGCALWKYAGRGLMSKCSSFV